MTVSVRRGPISGHGGNARGRRYPVSSPSRVANDRHPEADPDCSGRRPAAIATSSARGTTASRNDVTAQVGGVQIAAAPRAGRPPGVAKHLGLDPRPVVSGGRNSKVEGAQRAAALGVRVLGAALRVWPSFWASALAVCPTRRWASRFAHALRKRPFTSIARRDGASDRGAATRSQLGIPTARARDQPIHIRTGRAGG